jgi:hypothetical protein
MPGGRPHLLPHHPPGRDRSCPASAGPAASRWASLRTDVPSQIFPKDCITHNCRRWAVIADSSGRIHDACRTQSYQYGEIRPPSAEQRQPVL